MTHHTPANQARISYGQTIGLNGAKVGIADLLNQIPTNWKDNIDFSEEVQEEEETDANDLFSIPALILDIPANLALCWIAMGKRGTITNAKLDRIVADIATTGIQVDIPGDNNF